MAIERIKLNLIPAGTMPVCHASQYDKKRQIGIDIYNGLQPYILSDELLELDVRKPDGHIVTIDVPYTAGGNGVVFNTTEQMCAVAGANLCELKITKGEAVIGSLNFYMEIERSPMENGLSSDSEIANLTTQMRAIAEPMVEEIAPPIVEELVPQVIGEDYYTKTQTDEAIATATEDINNKIASEYDEEETYYRGDIVLYNGVLYECDNTDASGEFNPSDWKEITLGEGIEDVRDLLADYYTKSQSDYRFLGKTNPTGSGYFGLNRSGSAGANSVSVGWHNVANAQSSFAEGEGNTSSGYASHSEGYGNTASGLMAHAEGVTTESSGYGSHSEGVGTIANHIGQHVIGTYNVADTSTAEPTAKGNYIEIVGNGTDDDRRRNARTLDWNGNETLMGDLTYKGNKSLTSEISRLDGRIDDLPDNNTWRNIKVNGVEKLGNGISSGAVDFVGSENIEVDFDGNGNKVGVKTKNIYTKSEVDDIIYNILPDDTASGSVANFETDLALPLKSLEVEVNAKQDLHGYDYPWVAGAGKNKFNPESQIIVGFIGSNGFSSNNSRARTTYLSIKPNTTYTVSRVEGKRFVVATATVIPENGAQQTTYISNNTSSNITITSGNEDVYMWIFFYLYDTDTLTEEEIFDSIQVEEGSTATTWSPYENICPIEGWSEITLDVNGNTEVINLGGTYYGGHFTQDKAGHRQFVVTHSELLDMGNLDWRDFDISNSIFRVIVPNCKKPTDNLDRKKGFVCSIYPPSTTVSINANMTDKSMLRFGGYLVLRDTSFSDYTEIASAVRGQKLFYELATPYTIDLPDGEPINTLLGTNNIYADTGDTSVVFKNSVNGYVEKKIASVQALALNT
jgi:hypothetical protein